MRIEQDRGSHIDDVEGFYHMLSFARSIGGHTADIFEIDLPTGQRRRPLHRLGDAMVGRSNTIMVFENPINRFLRGNWHLKELQGGISLQIILDRLSSWDAT